jgi:hypothetical protein
MLTTPLYALETLGGEGAKNRAHGKESSNYAW